MENRERKSKATITFTRFALCYYKFVPRRLVDDGGGIKSLQNKSLMPFFGLKLVLDFDPCNRA